VRAPDDRQKIWNDPQRLKEWTNAALIASGVQDDDIPFENLPRMTAAEWNRQVIDIAKVHARQGRPEGLRKLFPEIAEFIHAPPLARGQRYKPQSDPFRAVALEQALEDVCSIRRIWREHFGKAYAPPHGPTALAIAAERYKLTEDQLLTYRKHRHRRR
jgi:hypothetical protein